MNISDNLDLHLDNFAEVEGRKEEKGRKNPNVMCNLKY